MKIVAISDTHCQHPHLKLPRGDVLLHAGDSTSRGRPEEVRSFLEWFARQKFEYKIFIAGNHDFFFEKSSPEQISKVLPEGIIYLNDSGVEINGLRIWGSPVTPTFFNWAFNRQRGREIRRHWDLIPPDTDILLTHGPVYGFLDYISTEHHVGCQDLLRKVLAVKPRVHVCGHIHESYGAIKRSGTLFINACSVNEQYQLVNKPVEFLM